MAEKRKRIVKKKVIPVPRDMAETEKYLKDIRHYEEEIQAIEEASNSFIAEQEKEIERLKNEAREKSRIFEEKVNELAEGVFIFAEANRKEITQDFSVKTVGFPSGDKIRWYFNPPSVQVKNEEVAIVELESRRLYELVRIHKEVNKEAILEHPEKIEGLKKVFVKKGDEIFAIVPAETGIELARGKKKFKKVALKKEEKEKRKK